MSGRLVDSRLLKRISKTIVLVSDMSRSVEFYRDRLGLELITQTSDWAEFDTGTTRLALQPGGDPDAPQSHRAAGRLSISFEVDDVVDAHDKLLAEGVTFTHPPVRQDFGLLAVFHDPDGLQIMLFERP